MEEHIIHSYKGRFTVMFIPVSVFWVAAGCLGVGFCTESRTWSEISYKCFTSQSRSSELGTGDVQRVILGDKYISERSGPGPLGGVIIANG